MLTLSHAQMEDVARGTARAFVARLTDAMTLRFPEQLRRLPRFARIAMVTNGLQVANGFGLTLEKTLGVFVGLQLETSADFHVHPLTDAMLSSDAPQQVRIDRMLRDIPHAVWDTIKRGADRRAWFEPHLPQQQLARIAAGVCTVFPELVEVHDEAKMSALFGRAVSGAQRHGLEPDAGIVVYASALAVYGTRLDEPGGPTWAADVFTHPPRPPAKLAALLRLQLLLDTDRLV